MITSRPRLFYGWWIVLTSALAMLFGSVPIVVYSFGVFLKPLAQDFHTGRAPISFAFTLHNIAVAAGAPLAGWLTDRFGARKVILPCTAVVGIVLLSNRFSSSRVWQLYAFFALVGLFEAGAGPVPYGKVVSRWFDRNRGGAIYGVIFSGFVLAGAFGAFIMGVAFDARHSYALPLVLLSLAAILGAAFMTCLGPYRYKPHGTSEAVAAQPSFEPSV